MSSTLPVRPVGWRILVEPVEIKRETAGGILLAEEAVKAQEYLRYFGKVVEMGHLSFSEDKFKHHPNAPAKPWCSVGQFVAFGKYAGQEIIVNVDGEQKRLRLLNDDEVMAVVDDPTALVIAY